MLGVLYDYGQGKVGGDDLRKLESCTYMDLPVSEHIVVIVFHGKKYDREWEQNATDDGRSATRKLPESKSVTVVG